MELNINILELIHDEHWRTFRRFISGSLIFIRTYSKRVLLLLLMSVRVILYYWLLRQAELIWKLKLW